MSNIVVQIHQQTDIHSKSVPTSSISCNTYQVKPLFEAPSYLRKNQSVQLFLLRTIRDLNNLSIANIDNIFTYRLLSVVYSVCTLAFRLNKLC